MKAPKRCFMAEIFKLKEDVEEENSPLETKTVLKLFSFHNDKVSIVVMKFWWLLGKLEALRNNKVLFELVKSIGGNWKFVEKEIEEESEGEKEKKK